jgi:hypothetical protein
MTDSLYTAARLRADAGRAPDAPLDLQETLIELFEVDIVLTSTLSVTRVRNWIERHNGRLPKSLLSCQDRLLKGAVVAWRGYGALFIDKDDPEPERRLTVAHEAGHFLHEHYYPRQDAIKRLGPQVRAVLDGLRPPTRAEQIDSILSRTSLSMHTHLLDRTRTSTQIVRAEADADAFALEILAPRAALDARFPRLNEDDASVDAVHSALVADFGLPHAHALVYARSFVAERARPLTLLDRLGL